MKKDTDKLIIKNVNRAIELLGGSYGKAAKILGVSKPSIFHWTKGNTKPTLENAIKIELATDRKIKREEIRPDIRWN